MGNFKAISKEVKEQVLHRVQSEGVVATQAARDAGISPRTVYKWLGQVIEKEPAQAELGRLKRENQFLLELVGKLTMQQEQEKRRGKK